MPSTSCDALAEKNTLPAASPARAPASSSALPAPYTRSRSMVPRVKRASSGRPRPDAVKVNAPAEVSTASETVRTPPATGKKRR